MASDAAARLIQVKQAISLVLTGAQEIAHPDGTVVKLAPLSELRRLEEELVMEINADAGATYRPVVRREPGGLR